MSAITPTELATAIKFRRRRSKSAGANRNFSGDCNGSHMIRTIP
jgi:hypothetical protein